MQSVTGLLPPWLKNPINILNQGIQIALEILLPNNFKFLERDGTRLNSKLLLGHTKLLAQIKVKSSPKIMKILARRENWVLTFLLKLSRRSKNGEMKLTLEIPREMMIWFQKFYSNKSKKKLKRHKNYKIILTCMPNTFNNLKKQVIM